MCWALFHIAHRSNGTHLYDRLAVRSSPPRITPTFAPAILESTGDTNTFSGPWTVPIKEDCKRGKWFSWSTSDQPGLLLNAFLVLTYLVFHRGITVTKTQGQSKEEMWGQKGPASPKIPRIGGRVWPDRGFSRSLAATLQYLFMKIPLLGTDHLMKVSRWGGCCRHREWPEQDLKVTEIPDMRPRVLWSTMLQRNLGNRNDWWRSVSVCSVLLPSPCNWYACLSMDLLWRWWVWIHFSENYHSPKTTLVTF